MDDRNDGIDMRSDFDRELDDMADNISKHGDDIIDRDDSNNRRQRRANRYDDDDMDSYSVQKRKSRASRIDCNSELSSMLRKIIVISAICSVVPRC